MKKLNLKLGGIKEMLTREQMKKVVGGYGGYSSCFLRCDQSSSEGSTVTACDAATLKTCGDTSNAVCVCT